MHHHDWRWLLLYVPLVLLLVGVMAAMVTLLETRQDASTRSVETMEGVTVYLDSQMAILYKGWEIRDCSQKLSNSSNRTLGFVQRVQTNDLVYHKRIILSVDGYNINNVSLTESKLEVFAPSGSIYLLKGSYVDYHICFHNFNNSSSQPSSEVNVLIFNSISNSLAFMHNSKSDEKTAIFSKELHLGGGSRNVCTTVNFNVTHADFYLVIFEIPKDSVLSFNSSTHQVYFNYTDPRTADCDIKSQGSCFVEIPGGIFSTEKYTIVSYEPYDDNSYRENTNLSKIASSSVTQLCVTPKRSLLISVIPAAIISLLLLLLLVVGSLHFTSYTFSIKRRRGYICVKPTTK